MDIKHDPTVLRARGPGLEARYAHVYASLDALYAVKGERVGELGFVAASGLFVWTGAEWKSTADAGWILFPHDHTAAGDGGILTKDQHDDYSEFTEIASPSVPGPNKIRVYAKDSGGVSRLFYKGDDGVEKGPLDAPGAPAAHAASHESGGGDKVHLDDIERSAVDATTHGNYTATPHISAADKAKIHDAVTLGADVDPILSLTGQQVDLDSQGANKVLAGPAAGADADPTFRALVDADIPPAIARDSEVLGAIATHEGAGDPHPGYVTPAEGDATYIEHADITPTEGFIRKTGAGAYTAHKSNLNAAVDPTVNDDSAAGYSVGSVWINTTADKVWQCVDDTPTAAVWKDLSTAGGGGGGTKIQDADADTSVDVEAAADEDKIRLTVAGVERLLLSTASPHLSLTGQLQILGDIGIGVSPLTTYGVYVSKSLAGSVAGQAILSFCDGTGMAATATGLYGFAYQRASSLGGIARGLDFQGAIDSSATGAGKTAVGIRTGVTTLAGSYTVNAIYGILLQATLGGPAPTASAIGIDMPNFGQAATALTIGIRIADQTLGTLRRCLEVGPTGAPYFRILGGWTGVANQTPIYISEGVTPTLRQVQWKDFSALVAGDKVMVLV